MKCISGVCLPLKTEQPEIVLSLSQTLSAFRAQALCTDILTDIQLMSIEYLSSAYEVSESVLKESKNV